MIIFSESSECLGVFLLVVVPPETEVLVLHYPGPRPHHMVLQVEGQSLHLGKETKVFLLQLSSQQLVNFIHFDSILHEEL